MRVLVAGAVADSVTDLKEHLTEQGHVVSFINSWELPASSIDLRSFDLILLDRELPYNYETVFCRNLRDKGFCGGIIVISTKAETPYKVSALDEGADYYFVSPCDIDELLAIMRAFARRLTETVKYFVSYGKPSG